MINSKLPEYEAEKSLFPNFKIEGQFKIVKLFILDGVDGGGGDDGDDEIEVYEFDY